jgi:cbb3-type cytochrome oxidase cytochrome c subunit
LRGFRMAVRHSTLLYIAKGVVSMKNHMSKLALFGLVIGAMAVSSSAARAQEMASNPNLVKRGKELWASRGCEGCHSIGKGRRAGPDLLGVTSRRSTEWLKKWLKNPQEMQASDSVAQQLVVEAKGVKMVNPHLSDSDIDAVISYLTEETREKSKK